MNLNRTATASVLLAITLTGLVACTSTAADPTPSTPASSTSQPFSIPAPDSATLSDGSTIQVSTTPSPPPTGSSEVPTTSGAATTTSGKRTTAHTTATAPRSSSATPSSGTTWKTPDYGSATAAVNAYLALLDAANQGLQDPDHPPTAQIYKYAAGQAYLLMTGAIADEKAHGRAWRGTPDLSRVLVVSNKTNAATPEVVLSDCPLPSKSWQEYDIKTGKVVPQPKYTPPPPYAATILMFPLNGTWVATSYKPDGSRTCTR